MPKARSSPATRSRKSGFEVIPRVGAIWRYPVKSLAGEAIERIALTPGRGLPGDRRFALVEQDGSAPPPRGWRPKSQCVTLLRFENLAQHGARYDEAGGTVTLTHKGQLMDDADALRAIAACAGVSGVVLADAGDKILTDVDAPLISLINRSSVSALGASIGLALDERRFRANIYFEGAPPWSELEWQDRRFRIGTAEIEILEPIGRCAATDVNPVTARRDTTLVTALSRHFGHTHMGVYAAVRASGEVRLGDAIVAS